MNEYSWKKKLFFFFILVSITIFIAILSFEIYARIFKKYDTPAIIKEKSLKYEVSVFSKSILKREQKAKIWDDKKKQWVEYYVSKKGYRGHDFNWNKPVGTIRIIIYGGSQVFDIYSPEEKDWPHQVEYILKNNGFPNVEVINAGIPGHASFDSFGKLFAEGHLLRPDYVIIDNAWNDFQMLRYNQSLLRERKPSQILDDPRINYQGVIDRMLCETSQLYLRLRSRYIDWKFNIDNEGAIPEGEYWNMISEIGLKQYKLDMEMFVDLARNIGAVPILMTQPRHISFNNTDEEKKSFEKSYQFKKMDHQTICTVFDKTDEIIKSVAKSKNALMIDASQSLTGKHEFFFDVIHTNDKGSNYLASITAEYLMDLLKEK
ncbi:MAG: SGNH/GDSL hydrolase family protein [Nitrospirae bacterium]|nr:SGNH/GDSL hydrolase family protein [Nitrospirota bacterium]